MKMTYTGKRLFDVLGSIFLLIFLFPVFLIIAIVYQVTGNKSVLFKQPRLGKNEIPFTIFKFRTLHKNESLHLAERKFVLGTWLRKSSLDELPQLVNVIKGDMSLVGPRPLPLMYKSLFSAEQRKRFKVKPGLTGLSQIKGGVELSWQSKFNYDITYLEQISFWSDLLILLHTVKIIFQKKMDGLNESPFTGNLK